MVQLDDEIYRIQRIYEQTERKRWHLGIIRVNSQMIS